MKRSIGSRRWPSPETTKSFCAWCDLPVAETLFACYANGLLQASQRVSTLQRWRSAGSNGPPGSTWGDWGDDDELGRINLLTPEKVLQGSREVQPASRFCLSLPARPARAAPRSTSAAIRRSRPHRGHGRQPGDVFFNVHMSEMPDFGDPKYVDVWADDVVTLSLQYSTQWDSLAHVGAEFDADGDGVEEAVYYNGYRAGTDLVGPRRRRGRRGHVLRQPPRPRAHGVPRRAGPRRPRRPRATTSAHEWRRRRPGHPGGGHGRRRRGGRARRHAPAPHRLRHQGRRVGGQPDPRELFTSCAYLDAHDEALLEWIADSQIAALVADNYAVEGLLGKDRDPSRHSFLPIHHLCLFKLGVPLGELWYLHELARLAARARPQPLPAHGPATAPPRHRRLPGHPHRHRLTAKVQGGNERRPPARVNFCEPLRPHTERHFQILPSPPSRL